MLDNFKQPISELCQQVASYLLGIRRSDLVLRIEETEAESAAPGFWDKPDQAQ